MPRRPRSCTPADPRSMAASLAPGDPIPENAVPAAGHPAAEGAHRCRHTYAGTKRVIRAEGLNTVCEEARCPNVGECWALGTATFMILGSVCTRNCGFCAIDTGRPPITDLDEPRRVAEATRQMHLQHVVITMVARDDLPDGGAEHGGGDDPSHPAREPGHEHRGPHQRPERARGRHPDRGRGPARHPQSQRGDGAAPPAAGSSPGAVDRPQRADPWPRGGASEIGFDGDGDEDGDDARPRRDMGRDH